MCTCTSRNMVCVFVTMLVVLQSPSLPNLQTRHLLSKGVIEMRSPQIWLSNPPGNRQCDLSGQHTLILIEIENTQQHSQRHTERFHQFSSPQSLTSHTGNSVFSWLHCYRLLVKYTHVRTHTHTLRHTSLICCL